MPVRFVAFLRSRWTLRRDVMTQRMTRPLCHDLNENCWEIECNAMLNQDLVTVANQTTWGKAVKGKRRVAEDQFVQISTEMACVCLFFSPTTGNHKHSCSHLRNTQENFDLYICFAPANEIQTISLSSA